ncbi:distal tail protein Dit [Lactococcus lactis]|uniref:distal tail protein Dit n=6 Tax=Lactococcus lactis TaxID=1358 RepID=UPI0012527366|nr:distal tail protein Dit [Lactococcus lactis]MDM7474889.1 phage tail family protein [Lactococcus lactis]NEX59363.1 phage tail protein [Lactococcus lactis]TYR29902.1 phage tail protein [Lactococcus lactis subsp. lactis bv. diacetylactis]
MFKVKYGDDYLTDYVRFIKVNRGVASESELLLEENSGDGTKVLKSRRKAKEIPMTFHVIDGLDVNVVREKLGSIISTNVIKQLTFSDTPNIYYEATLTGAIEYTDDGFFADGGFTLLVPSGYAESVDTKVLNNDNSGGENGTIINNADHSVSVLINNNGTLPIFPTIKITPTAESGFFGIAGQNVLEIGNPDEADEKRKTKQTTIADFKTQSDFDTNFVDATDRTTSWETNISPIPNNSKLKWKTDGIRMSTFSQAATWNAGIQRYDVPKDSTGQYPVNWHAQFNTFFIQNNARQAGRFQLYFCDENKQPLAMFEIFKGGAGQNAELIFWLIGGDNKMHKFGGDKPFNASTGKAPGGVTSLFDAAHGGQAIIKQGNKISFYWKGVAYSYLMGDAGSSTKLAYVYVVEASRQNYPVINNMSLKSFKLTNLNDGYMVNVVNKYQPNDEIIVNMDAKKIIVNGQGANSDYITGSDFFSIPAGQSQKIDIVYSSFTTSPPKIEFSWKERIL